MNFDHLFSRTYHKKDYNCRHFFNEAWQFVTGEPEKVPLHIDFGIRPGFVRLQTPVSPCVALFVAKNYTHVGMFWNGRILHISEKGVRFEPLEIASMSFKAVRFYR